jgi:hypothetical protein
MRENVRQFAENSMQFRPSDLRLVMERIHNHVVKPRMSAKEMREVVACLGFESIEKFGDHIGLEPRTTASWARYGLSRDAAQLLLALLNYRLRLINAMTDFESMTQIPLDGFFDNQQLP